MKINTNLIKIIGEAASLSELKIIGEGESYEKIQFTLGVKVEDDIFKVKFEAPKYEFGTKKESAKYKGFMTLYDGLELIDEKGKGDKISVTAKAVNNSFYLDGELKENIEYKVNVATRDVKLEKEGAIFKICGRIEEMIKEDDDTLTLKILSNETKYKGKIKGGYIPMRVMDKESIEEFERLFREGDISLFEGYIRNIKEEVYIDPKNLEPVEVRGFGSRRKELEAENERRAKLREEGLWKNVMTLCVESSDEPFTEDEIIDEYDIPFTKEDCDDMVEYINENLEKSKLRDEKRNNQTIDEEDVPF